MPGLVGHTLKLTPWEARQLDLCELQNFLVYIVSSRLARTEWWDPLPTYKNICTYHWMWYLELTTHCISYLCWWMSLKQNMAEYLGVGVPVCTPGHKEKRGQLIFTVRKESGPGKTEDLGSNDKMLSWDCVSWKLMTKIWRLCWKTGENLSLKINTSSSDMRE